MLVDGTAEATRPGSTGTGLGTTVDRTEPTEPGDASSEPAAAVTQPAAGPNGEPAGTGGQGQATDLVPDASALAPDATPAPPSGPPSTGGDGGTDGSVVSPDPAASAAGGTTDEDTGEPPAPPPPADDSPTAPASDTPPATPPPPAAPEPPARPVLTDAQREAQQAEADQRLIDQAKLQAAAERQDKRSSVRPWQLKFAATIPERAADLFAKTRRYQQWQRDAAVKLGAAGVDVMFSPSVREALDQAVKTFLKDRKNRSLVRQLHRQDKRDRVENKRDKMAYWFTPKTSKRNLEQLAGEGLLSEVNRIIEKYPAGIAGAAGASLDRADRSFIRQYRTLIEKLAEFKSGRLAANEALAVSITESITEGVDLFDTIDDSPFKGVLRRDVVTTIVESLVNIREDFGDQQVTQARRERIKTLITQACDSTDEGRAYLQTHGDTKDKLLSTEFIETLDAGILALVDTIRDFEPYVQAGARIDRYTQDIILKPNFESGNAEALAEWREQNSTQSEASDPAHADSMELALKSAIRRRFITREQRAKASIADIDSFSKRRIITMIVALPAAAISMFGIVATGGLLIPIAGGLVSGGVLGFIYGRKGGRHAAEEGFAIAAEEQALFGKKAARGRENGLAPVQDIRTTYTEPLLRHTGELRSGDTSATDKIADVIGQFKERMIASDRTKRRLLFSESGNFDLDIRRAQIAVATAMVALRQSALSSDISIDRIIEDASRTESRVIQNGIQDADIHRQNAVDRQEFWGGILGATVGATLGGAIAGTAAEVVHAVKGGGAPRLQQVGYGVPEKPDDGVDTSVRGGGADASADTVGQAGSTEPQDITINNGHRVAIEYPETVQYNDKDGIYYDDRSTGGGARPERTVLFAPQQLSDMETKGHIPTGDDVLWNYGGKTSDGKDVWEIINTDTNKTTHTVYVGTDDHGTKHIYVLENKPGDEQSIPLTQPDTKGPSSSGLVEVDHWAYDTSHQNEMYVSVSEDNRSLTIYAPPGIDGTDQIAITVPGDTNQMYIIDVNSNGGKLVLGLDSNGQTTVMLPDGSTKLVDTKLLADAILNRNASGNIPDIIRGSKGQVTNLEAMLRGDRISAGRIVDGPNGTKIWESHATIFGDRKAPDMSSVFQGGTEAKDLTLKPGANPNEFVVAGQKFEYPGEVDTNPQGDIINKATNEVIISKEQLVYLSHLPLKGANDDFVLRFDNGKWDLVNTKSGLTYLENISVSKKADGSYTLNFTTTQFVDNVNAQNGTITLASDIPNPKSIVDGAPDLELPKSDGGGGKGSTGGGAGAGGQTVEAPSWVKDILPGKDLAKYTSTEIITSDGEVFRLPVGYEFTAEGIENPQNELLNSVSIDDLKKDIEVLAGEGWGDTKPILTFDPTAGTDGKGGWVATDQSGDPISGVNGSLVVNDNGELLLNGQKGHVEVRGGKPVFVQEEVGTIKKSTQYTTSYTNTHGVTYDFIIPEGQNLEYSDDLSIVGSAAGVDIPGGGGSSSMQTDMKTLGETEWDITGDPPIRFEFDPNVNNGQGGWDVIDASNELYIKQDVWVDDNGNIQWSKDSPGWFEKNGNKWIFHDGEQPKDQASGGAGATRETRDSGWSTLNKVATIGGLLGLTAVGAGLFAIRRSRRRAARAGGGPSTGTAPGARPRPTAPQNPPAGTTPRAAAGAGTTAEVTVSRGRQTSRVRPTGIKLSEERGPLPNGTYVYNRQDDTFWRITDFNRITRQYTMVGEGLVTGDKITDFRRSFRNWETTTSTPLPPPSISQMAAPTPPPPAAGAGTTGTEATQTIRPSTQEQPPAPSRPAHAPTNVVGLTGQNVNTLVPGQLVYTSRGETLSYEGRHPDDTGIIRLRNPQTGSFSDRRITYLESPLTWWIVPSPMVAGTPAAPQPATAPATPQPATTPAPTPTSSTTAPGTAPTSGGMVDVVVPTGTAQQLLTGYLGAQDPAQSVAPGGLAQTPASTRPAAPQQLAQTGAPAPGAGGGSATPPPPSNLPLPTRRPQAQGTVYGQPRQSVDMGTIAPGGRI